MIAQIPASDIQLTCQVIHMPLIYYCVTQQSICPEAQVFQKTNPKSFF